MQVMEATKMTDMIDGRLTNFDWNNGWFTCSKHFRRLCDNMCKYLTFNDGRTEDASGTDYIARANIAIKRMHAKIEMLEFEVQQLKNNQGQPKHLA